MDVFSLVAKLSIDTSQYDQKIQSAEKEFSAFTKTVQTGASTTSNASKGLQNIANAIDAITHPIETFKKKQEEAIKAQQQAALAAETNVNKLNVLKGLYEEAQSKVAKLTAEFNKSAKEQGALATKTLELANDLEDAEKESATLKGRIQDLANAASNAGGSTRDLGNEMDKASSKASIFSDVLSANLVTKGIEGLIGACGRAISAIGNLVSKGFGAITGLIGKATSAYADYQQLVGGVETLFKGAADTVVENAWNAYKTAGMSANQYLESVMSFATSIINSTKKTTEKMTEEEISVRSKALDKQYSLMQKAQNKEYNLRKKGFDKEYSALQKFLNKEYDARRKELDKQYKALSDALDDEIEAVQKQNDKILKAAEKAYDQQVEKYEKATDARIALIDKEYTESIKLIDEEKYRRIKAIDDQINAIEALDDAQNKAYRDQERADKRAAAQKKLANASSLYARRKAQEELAALEAQIAKEDAEEQRKAQIEALKNQKDAIKDETDAKKDAAKEQRDNAVNAIKEESKATIAAMKERHEREMEELRESQKAQIEAMRDSKADQLEALKDSQSDELEAMKEAHNEQLESVREAQNEQLEAFKEAQQAKLEALKDSLSEQKKLLASGVSNETEASEADYERAARISDMITQDWADNVNKIGNTYDRVENAYRGFQMNNFSMLDNLRLGYQGNREEMQRLLDDAEKLTGKKYDISNFGDIAEAIHAIQDQLEITGTTMKEAESTVSGSTMLMKAAWENLLIGMADPETSDEEIADLFDKVADAAITALENIGPVIQRVIDRLPELIDKVGEFFESSGFKEKILPMVESMFATIFEAAGKAWEATKEKVLPVIKEVGKDVALAIWDGFKEAFPEKAEKIEAFFDTIGGFVDKVEKKKEKFENATKPIRDFKDFAEKNDLIPKSWNLGINDFLGIINGTAPAKWTVEIAAQQIKKAVGEAGDQTEETSGQMKRNLDGTQKDIGSFASDAKAKWENLKTNTASAWEKIKSAITGNSNTAQRDGSSAWSKLKENISSYAGYARDSAKSKFDDMKSKVTSAAKGMYDGVTSHISGIPGKIKGVIDEAIQYLKDLPGKAWQWGADLMTNFQKGIDEFVNDPIGSIKGFAGDMASYIHFSTPDRGPLADADQYMPDMMKLFAKGIKDNEGLVTGQIEKSFDFADVIGDQTVNVTGNGGMDMLNGGYEAGSVNYNITVNATGTNTDQDWNHVADIISERINAKANRRLVAVGAV